MIQHRPRNMNARRLRMVRRLTLRVMVALSSARVGSASGQIQPRHLQRQPRPEQPFHPRVDNIPLKVGAMNELYDSLTPLHPLYKSLLPKQCFSHRSTISIDNFYRVDCFGESSLFAATFLGIHSLFLHRGGHRNILSKNTGVAVVWFTHHKNTVLPAERWCSRQPC